MPELVLNNLEDLKKLEGWVIEKAGKVANTQPANTIGILISHPAAEKKVLLKIWPTVSLGRSGNVMVCNEELKIQALDFEEREEEKP